MSETESYCFKGGRISSISAIEVEIIPENNETTANERSTFKLFEIRMRLN